MRVSLFISFSLGFNSKQEDFTLFETKQEDFTLFETKQEDTLLCRNL